MEDDTLKNFWDIGKGVDIPEGDRDRWADEVLEMLKDSPYSYVRSGNSIVIAFDSVGPENEIQILDCVVRRTAKVNKYEQR